MILCLYEDDGPSGICGQAMSITRPWKAIVVVSTLDEAYDLQRMESGELRGWLCAHYKQVGGDGARKNARITQVFSNEWDDIHIFGAEPIIGLEES